MSLVYDVVILGGAFSGAATGLLLRRRAPDLRVLIIEKAEEFDRKVGESTTEVSSAFLTRVLGLQNYLGHHQLNKQGLRMWFARSAEERFDECAELGARYNSRLSGFQVDRATLDEHLLKTAVEAGCELWRPARVTEVELGGAGRNTLQVRLGEEVRTVQARWVVDATGKAALVARRLGHFTPIAAHPINALWARFTGLQDWDGHELRARFPKWAAACRTGRGWATNHLTGLGWWVWMIPLKGGDTSVGLVYDARLFTPPETGSLAERILAHVRAHPVGREMMSKAQPVPGDQRAYANLAYVSRQVAGDGWVLVGDAAGFIDPLYSPGLDFCAFTTHIAHTLVTQGLAGEPVEDAIAQYNRRFTFCYHAWFEGIYRDKYYYLGDAELMAAAFLLDIASYHLGPVRQVYADAPCSFDAFPFDGVPGRIVARFLRFYNGRLVHLAQRKLAAGVYGRRNAGWRLLIGGFVPDASVLKLLRQGVMRWLVAEWRNLWLPSSRSEPASMAAPRDPPPVFVPHESSLN